jgi:hypothetical protein
LTPFNESDGKTEPRGQRQSAAQSSRRVIYAAVASNLAIDRGQKQKLCDDVAFSSLPWSALGEKTTGLAISA